MPIVITNKTFNDNFGNALTYYQSNVGDRQGIVLQVETNIRISTINNPITIDVSTGQHVSSTESWLQEGFRIGDTIQVTKYDSGGAVIITWSATVNYVDDTVMDISPNQIGGYDIAAGEFVVYIVTSRNRDDLDVYFNHVLNGQPGNDFSLLDGEATRCIFTGVDSLAVSAAINAILPPNQSGQNVISASIQRLADPPAPNPEAKKIYNINIDFQTSGFYNSALFNSSNCLKVYARLAWASISGEPYDRAELVFNDDANTGFLNQPFNNGIAAATMLQGISELDYCSPSTHDIIIDGLVTDLGIGAAYVSLDDSYYKNRPTPGQNQLMLAPSSNVFLAPFPWTLISNANEFGAGYLIDINSVNTVGTQTTINITFTPQPLFTQFMDGRDDGDRLFYLWIKADNVNITAYEQQLICEPTPAGPLTFDETAVYLDHSENVTESTPFDYRIFDTEDDLAFYGKFRLTKNTIYSAFNVIVEAFNSVTGADFTLQQIGFNFNGVQISNDGRYLLDESQTIVTTLPTNSAKLNALLKLTGDEFLPDEYGVSIYYPFLLRWEYWLDQANANVDFYPNQNKNWFPYDNTGDWEVRLKFQLVNENNLANEHTENIIIRDYNAEEDIITTIELYVDATNQLVNIVTEGQLMRVVATHKLLNGNNWDAAGLWGMITVEPYESAPRFICSSVLPFDNNNLNPLTPLDNVQMNITFPAPNVARMECYFNPDNINLINGCKFTSKIKGCDTGAIVNKTLTDGSIKTTTTNDNKTLAI